MKKSRAYRRSQRVRVINRKTRVLRKIGGESYIFAWCRGKKGRFAKGKIHCSCYGCRSKSYDELSHSDRMKLISAQQQIDDVR